MRTGPEQAPPRADEAPASAPRGRLFRHAPALAAAAFGLAWFVAHAGVAVLDPTRIGWLYQRDWVAAQIGWSFFRSAPWGFPLGVNPSWPYGVGSTVGYADAIPLVAVLLKPLAGILPTDFQYVGAWLAICFAAQGFAGAKLAALATSSRAGQALGGALFASSPVLLHRFADARTGHASLCAHALLLAFLWLALAPVEAGKVRRRLGATLSLLLVAGGIHPYFVAMGAALALALVLRLLVVDRLVRPALAAAWTAGALASAAAGLVLFGYVGSGATTRVPGFGQLSADLLALVNPMGWSRLLPGFATGKLQYEGFGYLGAGVLVLAAATLATWIAARRRGAQPTPALRPAVPAAVAALLMAAFALSDVVTVAGRELVRIRPYDLVPALGATFRSSGRFVWPLHEVILAGAIAGIAFGLRNRPRALATALLAALLVQVAEIRPPEPLEVGDGRWRTPFSGTWALARGSYQHLALLPPFLLAGGEPVASEPDACGEPPSWGYDVWIPVADLAYRLGLTFDGGYLARVDEVRARAACSAVRRQIIARIVDRQTIWVVHANVARALRAAGASCSVLDGVSVCVAGDRRDPFAAALGAPSGR